MYGKVTVSNHYLYLAMFVFMSSLMPTSNHIIKELDQLLKFLKFFMEYKDKVIRLAVCKRL